MVQELLAYSRYDSGKAPLAPQPVPLRDALERLVAKLPEGAPPVSLEPAPDAPDCVQADARAFDRALRNLLANAARHADVQVRVSWQRGDDELILAVEDDGPGVPQGDREQIFEPFARLDASRERASGGVGLGLAIVQRILGAHGGEVRVEDSALGGARFVTTWPRAPRPASARTP